MLRADPPATPPGQSGQAPGHGGPARGRNTPPGLAVARFRSHAAPDRPISVTLMMDLRDHAGADALIQAQQDPDSPLYHQWITPEEFQARFGPTLDDIQAAKDFLTNQGSGTSRSRRPR
jgi:kumamolisin